MEGFFRWLKWRMDWNDLDHYMPNNTYRDTEKSVTGKPMDREQTLWFCLIFGTTYQSEMSWVIYNQFPNFWDIDLEKMQQWNSANMSRQKYARDCKYNKGRITDQVASMREVIGPYLSIENFFDSVLGKDEDRNFKEVYTVVKENFYKFGRMTTWLLCQTLYETAGLPVKPSTMLASDPSSWSVRSGLMYVYGRDDMIEAKDKNVRMSKADLAWVDYKEHELLAKSLEFLGSDYNGMLTYYTLESHLCQYKKLMLGGDYAGHSSGDHVSRASWLAERWPEVPFNVFFEETTKKHHPLVRNKRENKALRDLCAMTGQMINMHEDFSDMPDVYKEIGIDRSWLNDDDKKSDALIKKRISSYVKERGLLSRA